MRVCKHGCDVSDFARIFKNYFIKAINRALFACLHIASSLHSEGGENSPKSSLCLDETICKHGKSSLLRKQKNYLPKSDQFGEKTAGNLLDNRT